MQSGLVVVYLDIEISPIAVTAAIMPKCTIVIALYITAILGVFNNESIGVCN